MFSFRKESGCPVPTSPGCPIAARLSSHTRIHPGRSSSLFVQRIDSQDRRQITFPPAGAMGDSSPALSADGSALVFSRMTGVGPADLWLLALGTDSSPKGEPKRITFFNWLGAGVAWAPNGRAIVYSYG